MTLPTKTASSLEVNGLSIPISAITATGTPQLIVINAARTEWVQLDVPAAGTVPGGAGAIPMSDGAGAFAASGIVKTGDNILIPNEYAQLQFMDSNHYIRVNTVYFEVRPNDRFVVSANGRRFFVGNNGAWIKSGYLGWGTLDTGAETCLYSDAPDQIDQRNGVNPQAFRVYSTYTSATDKEFLEFIAQSGGNFLIRAVKGSLGGTVRNIEFSTAVDFSDVISILDGLTLPNAVPAVTTNKLYNNAGTLYFSGSAIGGAGGGDLSQADIDTLAELNAILTDATLIDTGDSRLSDARTPTAHNHPAAEISDSTAAGRSILTAADAPAQRALLNVEDGADATDTANVTAAGALMDSEVDADIKTLSLPASTTISTFGASLVDDADAAAARSTIGLSELSKSVTIEDPTANEDISLWFTNQAITITEIRAVVVGSSTPSVTWTVRHGTDRSAAGAEVVTGGTTTTSTTTGSDVTSFNDATVVADSFVWLETTAQSGTVDELDITIFYTID